MNDQEQDHLLNELLAGEEVSNFRQASLARAKASIRSRNRRRRAVRIGALAMLPVLGATLLIISRQSSRIAVKPAEEPRPAVVVQARPEPASVPVISDEELFALFPGRQMALIGPPGHQELVFLDQAGKTGSTDSIGL